jgi:hypothetical protein
MRLFLALLLAAASALAQERKAPEPFEKFHAMMKPQAGEWNWAKIPWMGDLGEARKKAAAEGKPLYVWTMAGEPLGQC